MLSSSNNNFNQQCNIIVPKNYSVLINSIPQSSFLSTQQRTTLICVQINIAELEKCINCASSTLGSTSTTYIIHRSIVNSIQSSEPKLLTKSLLREKANEKYENLLKYIKKKFVQDNFISYSITNTTLFAAEQDVKTNENKLQTVFDSCNFMAVKSRLLTKDLRISSSSDLYLQIFTENLMKIIRDSCRNIFLKKDLSQSSSLNEMSTHKLRKPKTTNTEFINLINRNREREMAIFNNYLTSTTVKTPGLMFGPIGSGKSTLLFELSEKIKSSPNTNLIIRRCGKTINSSSLQLLLASITQQVHFFSSKVKYLSQSSEYAVCVYEFWLSLTKSNPNKQLFILLDDVDKLYPSSHTDMVKWLPHSLPRNVKILLTSSSDSFYQGFKRHYDLSNIVNIPMIDSREAIKLLTTLIPQTVEKAIPEDILNQASFVLQENSTPLFISLLSWSLDATVDPNTLNSDIKSVIKIYLKKLELSTTPLLFIHTVSYLALSRFGLTLSELSDILSLDNKIVQLVDFDVLTRNGFRFPIYIIEELIGKFSNILESFQTNKRLVIRLKHNIYITTVIEHYQLLHDEGKYFYQNLFDYWTSKYESGKLKPLFEKLTDDDLPNELSHIYLKRNIMFQPYYSINNAKTLMHNERKLIELPFLLITFEKSTELYKYIIFNFEYLFSSLSNFGMNFLVSELYFCRQINDVKNNFEMELLLVQLRLLPNEVVNDAQLLSTELTGRLSHLVGSNSLISQLHLHIDSVAPKVNSILSAIPNYSTIDVENLRVEIGMKTQIILSALSPDNRFIATIHSHKPTNEWIVTIWDTRSATKSQIINLGIIQNIKVSFMFYMPQRDELLLIKYEDSNNQGFLVVNVDFSNIENTIKLPKKSAIKLEYVSKSHLYIFVNEELQVLLIPSGQKDHNLSKLSWPTILSPNDKYLIGPKPPTKRDISEKNVNFNLRVMNGVSGEMVCQLISNHNSCALFVNVRNEVMFLSTKSHGIIYKYEIGQIAKKDVKKLKFSYQLQIMEQSTMTDAIRDLLTKFLPNIKAYKLQLSVDEKYLLADYNLNDSIRLTAVWNLTSKSIVFCSQVSHSATVSFSTDAQYLCFYLKNETLKVINLSNGTNYGIDLDEYPEQIYMLRSGGFFMVYTSFIKIAALKSLIKKNRSSDKNVEFLPETFHISLPKPKVSSENVVLFSNDENTSQFLYYNLLSNAIFNLDISHTNESLTEFANDKFLSPDGEKLLLVFGFRLSQKVKENDDQSIDKFMLKVDQNGLIISSRNDYRKPEIPGENYFIGKGLDSNKSNKENNDAYSQKIVKIVNLKNSQTIFQVSLTGEKILKLTDNILLTFKPDYASLTKNNDEAYDIVSVYNIIEGRFVSYLYIEYPVVDSILIPQDKEKLLVSCGKNGKFIKILGGEYFSAVLLEFDIQILLKYFDEFARSSSVTKVFVFKENSNSILVQYSWLEHNSNTVKSDKEVHYAKIDMNKKEIICQLSTVGRIVDVSSDGSMAVDSLLNVYELSKGNILRKLQNAIILSNETNFGECTSLFINDALFIVTLDPIKRNLWIISNNDESLVTGRAILTSSLNSKCSDKPFEICLGLDGRFIIVFNDQEFKIFAIRMTCRTMPEVPYKSNLDRIKKLL